VKATIEFDLSNEDDRWNYRGAVYGGELRGAVVEALEMLKARIRNKHGEHEMSDDERRGLEQALKIIMSNLEERRITELVMVL
jgi:hypothetical protein